MHYAVNDHVPHYDNMEPRPLAKSMRLVLRPFREADVSEYADIIGDAEVMQFIGDGAARSRDRAATEIAGFIAHQKQHGFSRWAIQRRDGGRVVGMAGFAMRGGEVDFGGRLHRKCWGNGYAAEAMIHAIEVGFSQCGLRRITTITDQRNKRAWKLNRKIGMICEGTVSLNEAPHLVHGLDAGRYVEEDRFLRNLALLAPLQRRMNRVSQRIAN